MTKTNQRARETISNISQELFDHAYDLHFHYATKDILQIVERMTDSEFERVTKHNGSLRMIYHSVLSQPENIDILRLAEFGFDAAIKMQAPAASS